MPRKRRFLSAAEGPVQENAWIDVEDVLRGLSPQLVIELARLAGATREDLEVTLHLMPYGDRAVMAAYGLIEMSPPGESGERTLRVDPSCLEAIAAAAELVASVVDPAAVAARLQSGVDEGRAAEPYVPVMTVAQQQSDGTEAVGGVVRSRAPAGDGFVRLQVDLDGPSVVGSMDEPGRAGSVTVITHDDPSFRGDARVSLAYFVSENPLSIAASDESPVVELHR